MRNWNATVRAVVEGGAVRLLDPLPEGWEDGDEVSIRFVQEKRPLSPEEIDRWNKEWEEAGESLTQEDCERFKKAVEGIRADGRALARAALGIS